MKHKIIIIAGIFIFLMHLKIHAQSNKALPKEAPFEFTISGNEFRSGKTYNFPPDSKDLPNCGAFFVNNDQTQIHGIAQFPPEPLEQIFIEISIIGSGKLTQSLNGNISPSAGFSISFLVGKNFQAADGEVSIDSYSPVGGFVSGHFSATGSMYLYNGEGKEPQEISGYKVVGKFKVQHRVP